MKHVHSPVPTRDMLYSCRTCPATLKKTRRGMVEVEAKPEVTARDTGSAMCSDPGSETLAVGGLHVRRRSGAM